MAATAVKYLSKQLSHNTCPDSPQQQGRSIFSSRSNIWINEQVSVFVSVVFGDRSERDTDNRVSVVCVYSQYHTLCVIASQNISPNELCVYLCVHF